MRRKIWCALVAVAAVAVAGCGSTSSRGTSSARSSSATTTTTTTTATSTSSQPVPYTTATICASRVRAAIARNLRVAPSALTERASTANSDFPQCRFATRLHDGRWVVVTTEVDTEQSAFQVLDRTIVEAAQVFTPHRMSPGPVQVQHLGIEASWFPEEQHLETTDAHRLVIATLIWPGASQARKISLATVAARPYLGRPGYAKPIIP